MAKEIGFYFLLDELSTQENNTADLEFLISSPWVQCSHTQHPLELMIQVIL
jgi:hypothetical protein